MVGFNSLVPSFFLSTHYVDGAICVKSKNVVVPLRKGRARGSSNMEFDVQASSESRAVICDYPLSVPPLQTPSLVDNYTL
jgi:hypothetical protein